MKSPKFHDRFPPGVRSGNSSVDPGEMPRSNSWMPDLTSVRIAKRAFEFPGVILRKKSIKESEESHREWSPNQEFLTEPKMAGILFTVPFGIISRITLGVSLIILSRILQTTIPVIPTRIYAGNAFKKISRILA